MADSSKHYPTDEDIEESLISVGWLLAPDTSLEEERQMKEDLKEYWTDFIKNILSQLEFKEI